MTLVPTGTGPWQEAASSSPGQLLQAHVSVCGGEEGAGGAGSSADPWFRRGAFANSLLLLSLSEHSREQSEGFWVVGLWFLQL